MGSPTIYWHIGTERTGTKYLQQSVFPNFKGIGYIDRSQFHSTKAIIDKGEHSTYLVSFELNLNADLEPYIKGFLAQFPAAIPIVVFRPQDQWLISQYKRHLKNGKPGTFTDMFDVANDNGLYKRDDLSYTKLIEKLEHYFQHPPIVMLYQDMQKQPEAFIKLFAQQVGAMVNMPNVNLHPRHRSYNDKQLMALYSVSKHIDISKTKKGNSKVLHALHSLWKNAVRYGTLNVAKVLPDSYFHNRKLIQNKDLEAIKAYYQTDQEQLLQSPYLKRVQ